MVEDLTLHLNVIASTNIKRKKPWSQIIWIGKEGEESLILLNPKQISLLYLPDGKTKKTIPKVSPLVAESISVNYSNNGLYLAGLLHNGSVFLWKKDGNKVWMIEGLPQYVSNWETKQVGCVIEGDSVAIFRRVSDCNEASLVRSISSDTYSIYISDEATKILVAASDGSVYIWLWSSVSSVSIKEQYVVGCWYPVDIAENIQDAFRRTDHPVITAIFYSNVVVGCCCNCSFLLSDKQGLTIITLYLNFLSAALSPTSSFYPFTFDWMSVRYSQTDSALSKMNDKPVAGYSRDGQILAVAINKTVANRNKMMFLSPFTNTTVVSDMKGSGTYESSSTHFSYYWITSMKWTYNNLFVVCIQNSGSVCILSRLGEPILLRTNGLSQEMGPAFFLPIHPVIIVRNENISKAEAETSQPNEILSFQKFSISTHPHLPIIICSDGFLVTVMELPYNLSCMSLVQDLVSWSSHQLSLLCKEYKLDITLHSEQNSSADGIVVKENISSLNLLQPPQSYYFEDVTYSGESDQSIVQDEHIVKNLDAGKITFGVPSTNESKLQPKASKTHSEILKNIYLSLLLAWKLEVTSGCIWDPTKAKVTKMTLLNTSKVFQLFLGVSSLTKSLKNEMSDKSSLFHLIRMFREFLHLLHFDFLYQRQLNVIICFVHKTVKLILTNENLSKSDPAIKTLLGCEALLNFTNQIFSKTYTWSSKYPPSKASGREETILEINSESEDNSWYEPSRNSLETSNSRKKAPKRKPDIDTEQKIQNSSLQELLPTWKLLMKHAEMVAAEDFKHRKENSPCHENEYSEILRELFQRLNTHLFSNLSSTQDIKERPHNISKGERYSLESRHTLAEDAWKEQLAKLKDATSSSDTTSSCILHALLYTYLLRGQLAKAMEMVETLVLKDDISAISKEQMGNSQDLNPPSFLTIMNTSISSQQKVPCIKNAAIRQVVQSLARYMAMYFCNMQLFIFPPNSPLPLPPLRQASPHTLKERIIPKFQQDVTSVVSSSGLEDIWTVSRCLEYLLLSGLVPEAAWFSNKVGDWKAALSISAALMKHKEIFPLLYERDSLELYLPEDLHPSEILRRKLSVLLPTYRSTMSSTCNEYNDIFEVKDDHHRIQLTAALDSLLTAGIVCGVDLVTWLFPVLVESLQNVVSNFSASVTSDFHLPAPLFYLWQPSDLNDASINSAALIREKELRHMTSVLIRLILIVLEGAKLSLPLARWYIQQLMAVCKRAANKFGKEFDGPVTEFPDIFLQLGSVKSSLQSFTTNAKCLPIFSSFRNFCGLTWFLHVRDQLSLHNRLRRSYVEKQRVKQSRLKDEEWYALCEVCLTWTIHFIPFSHYLADEAWSYKVLLSVLAEIEPSVYTAQILATFCYDAEQLDCEVQEKLDILLKRWQTFPVIKVQSIQQKSHKNSGIIKRSSSSEKSLSVYFQEYCCTVQKMIDKKKNCFGNYCQFIFDSKLPTEHSISVGSFPFEISESYGKFLDMFYDISFSKLLEDEERSQSKSVFPLVDVYGKEIVAMQMESMPFRTMTGRHPKQSLLILSKPCKEVTNFRDSSNILDPSFGSVNQHTPKKVKGLFNRSHSADASYHCPTTPTSQTTAAERRQLWSKTKTRQGRYKEMMQLSNRSKSLDNISDKQNILWSFDIDFGSQYLKLNQLVDWLIMWAKKNQVLISQLEVERKDGDSKSAMHTIVQPQLLVLALWLLEQKYYPLANTIIDKNSVQFTSSLNETSQKPSTIQNPRNNLEKKKQKKNSLSSSMSKDKGPSLSPALSFDKEEFRKWLRSSENGIEASNAHETQSLSSNKTISKPKKKKKKEKKKIVSSPLESVKPFKFKDIEEKEEQEERDKVNQAYEYVLNTINEASFATELSNVSVSETQQLQVSHSDPLSVSITSSFSADSLEDEEISSNQKPLQCSQSTVFDTKNSVLSGTRSSLDNNTKSKRQEPNKESLISEVKQHVKQDVVDIIQLEIRKLIDVQNDQFKSVIDALLPHKKVKNKRNKKMDSANKISADTNVPECSFSTDSESENQRPPIAISSKKTQADIRGPNSTSFFTQRNVKHPKTSVGNIREVLKELENLQEVSHTTKDRSSTLISKPLNNENLYQRMDPPQNYQHQHIVNNNRKVIDVTKGRETNERLHQRYPLFNLNSVSESPPFLSLPDVQSVPEPSINNQIVPQTATENPVRMPLLCLTKKQPNIFKIPEPNLCIPRVMQEAVEINNKVSSQKYDTSCCRFVNYHNATNANINTIKFPQQTFKMLIDSSDPEEPEEPSQMPLLKIPKDKSELLGPHLSYQLIPPELIADFKQKLLEKNESKKKNFIKFQQSELQKLKEDNEKTSSNPPQFHYINLKQVAFKEDEKSTQSKVNEHSLVNHVKRSNRRKKKEEEEMKTMEKTLTKAEAKFQVESSPLLNKADETKLDPNNRQHEKIHQDFIINPGSFDNFLKLGAELGVPTNNYSKIQYDVATRLQKLRLESKRIDTGETTKQTYDVSVVTDPVIEETKLTADVATSITKDTGSDPVTELLMIAHNQGHEGNILTPDIYLNLQCTDFLLKEQYTTRETKSPNSKKKEESSHTFLNVIDVSSSSVMAGIYEETPVISQPLMNTKLTQESDVCKPYSIDIEALLSDFNYKSEISNVPFQVENTLFERKWKAPTPSCNNQPKVFEPRVLSPINEHPIQLSETPYQISQPFVNMSSTEAAENKHVSPTYNDIVSSIEELASQIISIQNSPDRPLETCDHSDQVSSYDDISLQSLRNSVHLPRNPRNTSQEFLKTNLTKMSHQLAVLDKLALKMEEESRKTKLFNEEINSIIAQNPDGIDSLSLKDDIKQAQHLSLTNISAGTQIKNLVSQNIPPSSFLVDHVSHHSKHLSAVKDYEPYIPFLRQQHHIQIDRYGEVIEEPKEKLQQPPVGHESPIEDTFSNVDDRHIKPKSNEDQVQWLKDMSILSSVSDIMVDLFRQGHINLTNVGDEEDFDLQNNQEEISVRNMMQMSMEKLAQMTSGREENSNNPKQVWMTDQKNKLHKEFKERQTEMQHQERKPFNNGKQESISFKAIEKAIKSREQQRSERFTKTQEKRFDDVEKLIQSFQSDQAKIKQQYSLPKCHSHTQFKRNIVSPNSSKSSLHAKNLMTTRTIRKSDTTRVQDNNRPHLQSTTQSFLNIEHPRSKVPQPNSPSESSNYAATTSDKPNSSKNKDINRVLSLDRPYQKIVRCQRPEITRKVMVTDTKPYIQRLADIKHGNLQSAKVHDKPKLYGVKKIPTDHTKSTKSQSEHLQEVNKSNSVRNSKYEQTESFHQRIPRHKPLSYTERLQQLSNRGTYTSKGLSNTTVTLKKATFNGHHPLQETSTQHRMKMTQDKTPVRHHPYVDSHQVPDGYSSDVSEWSLDDRIKNILYEDKKTVDQEFFDEGSNSASDYYDEVISAPQLQLDPIDVVASLSSCSLSSHIDWTAVEKGLTEQINS